MFCVSSMMTRPSLLLSSAIVNDSDVASLPNDTWRQNNTLQILNNVSIVMSETRSE